jgi:hypothetical protein
MLLNECMLVFGNKFFSGRGNRLFWSLILDSINLHIVQVRAMGRKLFASTVLPFLNKGVIKAVSQTGGITLCSKHNVNSCDRGKHNSLQQIIKKTTEEDRQDRPSFYDAIYIDRASIPSLSRNKLELGLKLDVC